MDVYFEIIKKKHVYFQCYQNELKLSDSMKFLNFTICFVINFSVIKLYKKCEYNVTIFGHSVDQEKKMATTINVLFHAWKKLYY